MTREELIAAIEGRLGLRLLLDRERSDADTLRPIGASYLALSPAGAVLFEIELSAHDGDWSFAGTGALLAMHWAHLTRLGRAS